MTVTRGTSNGNATGSAEDRRRRRAWLVATYRADFDLLVSRTLDTYDGEHQVHVYPVSPGSAPMPDEAVVPACRCYRCGRLLHAEVTLPDGTVVESTLTVDRIIPGAQGGKYRRDNIRPACSPCNSSTGGATRRTTRKK